MCKSTTGWVAGFGLERRKNVSPSYLWQRTTRERGGVREVVAELRVKPVSKENGHYCFFRLISALMADPF
jgi:hypothetical protein